MVFVLAKKNESLLKFLFCVSLTHFGGHDSQEIIVIYRNWSLFVTLSFSSIFAGTCVG